MKTQQVNELYFASPKSTMEVGKPYQVPSALSMKAHSPTRMSLLSPKISGQTDLGELPPMDLSAIRAVQQRKRKRDSHPFSHDYQTPKPQHEQPPWMQNIPRRHDYSHGATTHKQHLKKIKHNSVYLEDFRTQHHQKEQLKEAHKVQQKLKTDHFKQ